MFTGIEEVDWASMGHAYTESATDVPDLLRGLASDDPARRDIALDGMYGRCTTREMCTTARSRAYRSSSN